VVTILLIIDIVLWVYVVKFKRLVLKLKGTINSINYNTGDFSEKFKEINDKLK